MLKTTQHIYSTDRIKLHTCIVIFPSFQLFFVISRAWAVNCPHQHQDNEYDNEDQCSGANCNSGLHCGHSDLCNNCTQNVTIKICTTCTFAMKEIAENAAAAAHCALHLDCFKTFPHHDIPAVSHCTPCTAPSLQHSCPAAEVRETALSTGLSSKLLRTPAEH